MNDKKNIDRLFQERFKDFEAVPDDKIWNNIHDALHEKKSKKIIPLWWKLSGIAAGFLLAFLAFNTNYTSSNTETKVVIVPAKIENTESLELNKTSETEIRVAVESNNSTENSSENNSKTTKINGVQKEQNKNSFNRTSIPNTVKKSIQTNAVASANKKESNSAAGTKEPKNNLQNSGVATSNKNNLNSVQNSKIAMEEIAQKSLAESKDQIETKERKFNTDKIAVSNAENLVNKSTNKIDKDSIALALSLEPNPLVELLKKKNEKENGLAVAKLNRWNVTTNVAPVFFNSASNGSPIEAQFEENSKSYDNNLSVGVGVQYAVNKKLAFRTGVNKVSLGYGTNDVVFFGGLNSSGVSNLASNNATSNIEVISANNTMALRPFEDNLQNMESGVLNQRMGYYEVPLEFSYTIVNRKFGVHVIGGLSTLFLNENSVSVQSANTTVSLGEANNLNDVHFSGNAGIGFKYELWKNFEARFEPTLKYQFNTFSRDAGNFKPYFVGLYSGVSFRF